ncbi:MAG: glycosyltransferase [Gammaproteobacteria bacterium]|nr:glycosyltransferase [Gammaproteobacteria bacterium]
MMKVSPRILCIGEEWRGSNASGLFYALSRIGCTTTVINELAHISLRGSGFLTKAINWGVRSTQIQDFNAHLIKISKSVKPDLVLVYKGSFIEPETIQFWKKFGVPIVNFFPDVSFLAHGKYIPRCISLYDHIFTTKTFAAKDLQTHFSYNPSNVSFIPHGFDPALHRRMDVSDSPFSCEASFIGNYSKHKSLFLGYLKGVYPQLDLKIWGGTWGQSMTSPLTAVIQNIGVLGDSYVLALNSSKINIALLSEAVLGASSGDQITSRTFHITGCGGFMLHQRTQELLEYFDEGKEMVCFDSMEEMAEKIKYYLLNEQERIKIQEAGYQRAQKAYSLDNRALELLVTLKTRGIIK